MIYLVRNAKDVAVSYYFFYQMAKVHPEPGTWNEFLEKFMAGDGYQVGVELAGETVASASDMMLGRSAAHPRPPCPPSERRGLFIADKQARDPQREIRKVMEFLEKPIDEQLVEKIMHYTSFKEMHQNHMTNYTSLPSTYMDHSISPFMRKGELAQYLKSMESRPVLLK
ncbi:hypothetical protein JD844_001655 [Phrynosoma platyrhinos]|uniref:Sulfotransferase n=1 Tax=Phrynosoma platyrhinos TaxID=52577 RepID=A0ABQ7TBR6_PHRPL|nr:hypothetical protein JD844_001655 [Phrynosoma platyrhinos]